MVPSWSEIKSQPWFSQLSPEQQAQSLDLWSQDMQKEIGDDAEQLDLLGATTDLEKRSLFGEQVPTLDQYLPEYKARKAADQQGFLSQMGGALKTGFQDTMTGLGVTFDTLTGDNEELAQGLAAMNETQKERQANTTSKDLALEKALAENAKQFKEAKGFWPSTKELLDYVGIAATNPVAMTKMALESAPNALISIGATTAGAVGGTALGGPAAGVAAASAAGSAANIPMEIPGAIRQKLLEATGGQAANWNAAQIKDYLDANPQVKEEGLQKGLVRGAAIGVVEGLTAGVAGKVATIPERAAQKAVLADVARQLGKEVASPVDVADFIRAGGKEAQDQLAGVAADALSQYSKAQKAGMLAGAAGIETAGEGLGELSAQVASGDEINPTDVFVEMAAGGVLSGLSTAGARLASLPGQIVNADPKLRQQAQDIQNAEGLAQQAATNENASAAAAAAKAVINEATSDMEENAAVKLVDVASGLEDLGTPEGDLLTRVPLAKPRGGEIFSPETALDGQQFDARRAYQTPTDLASGLEDLGTTEGDIRTRIPLQQPRGGQIPTTEQVLEGQPYEQGQPTPQQQPEATPVRPEESAPVEALPARSGPVVSSEPGLPVVPEQPPAQAPETDVGGGVARKPEQGAGMTQRDTSKPEQMTPEESYEAYTTAKELAPNLADMPKTKKQIREGIAIVENIGIKDPDPELQKMLMDSAKAETAQFAGPYIRVQRIRLIEEALEEQKPVSSAAVDTYGITLPEGYVRQGDLYVFAPEAPAASAPEAETKQGVGMPQQKIKDRRDSVPVEDRADYDEFMSLMERRGPAQSKVKGFKFTKADEKRFQELGKKLRKYLFETVDPSTDPVIWKDTRGQDIHLSAKGTLYTVEKGRVRTGADFGSENFVRGFIPKPVPADFIEKADAADLLPEGYVRQGDLYVFAPEAPTKPTTPETNATLQGQVPENRVEERVQTDEGRSPAETGRGNRPLVSGQVETKGQEGLAEVTIPPQGVVPTAPLPEGQPMPGGSGTPPTPARQALGEEISTLPETGRAKWTPEVLDAAEDYVQTGNPEAYAKLSKTQKSLANRVREQLGIQDEQDEMESERQKRIAASKAQTPSTYSPRHIEQSADIPTAQVVGRVSEADFQKGLDIVGNLIRNARATVISDSLANLLSRSDITEAEKDAFRKGAQGIYSNGRAIIARDSIRQTVLHTTPAQAAAAVIFHELMHKGSDILRSDPKLAETYQAWRSMLDENVTDEMLDSLVRRKGYSSWSDWKTNPASKLRAQEEVFVRQMEDFFNRKGDLLPKEKNILTKFLDWVKGMLESVFGVPVEGRFKDAILEDWGRKFIKALQTSNEVSVGEIQRSLSETDAEYMEAVNAGDMDKAQSMVDEAAKAAGYAVGPLLHGTEKTFTEFKEANKPKKDEMFSFGFHFTDSPELARRYGKNSISAFLRVTNPLDVEQVVTKGEGLGAWLQKIAPKTVWFPQGGKAQVYLKNALDALPAAKVKQALLDAGYDGLTYNAKFEELNVGYRTLLAEGKTTVALSSAQIKSADPVTYDESGNVIPLSQRFNPESPDIRYSIESPAQDTRTGTDRLATFDKEEREALTKYMSGNPQFDKLKQFLGLEEAAELGQVESILPLKMAAMDTIGFNEDKGDNPIVSKQATANAYDIAEKLTTNSGFGVEYQQAIGPESAATAVLQMELLRYALALSRKGDNRLLSMLRKNWNSIVLGKYITATTSGRILGVRSNYVSEVLRTIDRMDAEMKKTAVEKVRQDGIPQEQAEGIVRDLDALIKKAQIDYDELTKSFAGVESEAPSVDPYAWIERALGKIDAADQALVGKLFRDLARLDKMEAKREEFKKAANAPEASFLDDIYNEEIDIPNSPEELDAEIDKTLSRISETLKQLNQKPEVLKKVKEKLPKGETKPVDLGSEPAVGNEDANESTQAAERLIDEMKQFLEAKHGPKKPDKSVYAVIKKVVKKAIENSDEYPFDKFQSELRSELKSFDIDEEVQEELIAKAFTVFSRFPTKEAEKMTAKFLEELKEKEKVSDPAKAVQLRELMSDAVGKFKEQTEDQFSARLLPKLIALTVPEKTARGLISAAYKAAENRRKKMVQRKIERIKEALINGSRKTLVVKLLKDGAEKISDGAWRDAALLSIFQKSGLTKKEAAEALDSVTDAEATQIFGTAAKLTADKIKERLAASIKRVLEEQEKRLKTTPGPKAPLKESLRQLIRANMKQDMGRAIFVAEAATFGATEAQANTLYARAKMEADLLNAEKGKPITKFSKLLAYIKSNPTLISDPASRSAALQGFLIDNGYTEEQAKRMQSLVEPLIQKASVKAKQQALDRAVAVAKKKEEAKATPAEKNLGNKIGALSENSFKLLESDLKKIRMGLGDLEADPSQSLASALGFNGFRPTDYQALSELDAKITQAAKDGRPHDMAKGLKELYELLGRRSTPKTFADILGVAFNNNALSSFGTLAINAHSPASAGFVRFLLDLGRASATLKFSQIPDLVNAMVDSMKKFPKEFGFGLLGGASTVAMNQQVQKVTSLQREFNDAWSIVRRTGRETPERRKQRGLSPVPSPVETLKALYTSGMTVTDIVRRILATLDHSWSAVFQDYFLKSQAIGILGGKFPRETYVPMLFSISNTVNQSLIFENTMINDFAQQMGELKKAGKFTKEALLELTQAPPIEGLSADAVTFDRDFKGSMRRIIAAYDTPESLERHLLKGLARQRNEAHLRANDRMKSEILNFLEEKVPGSGQQTEKFIRNESDYELGTHEGEEAPPLDIANTFFNLIRTAGQSVIAKHPLLGRMIIGYYGVPANLLNRAMWFTPYGLYRYGLAYRANKNPVTKGEFYQKSMETQSQMNQRLVEALAGTAGIAVFMMLKGADDDDERGFNVTLAGPTQKTEADAWNKKGHQKGTVEYVTKDGTVYKLNWARGAFEPLKAALVMVGAMDDMRLNRKLGDGALAGSLSEYLSAMFYGWSKQAAFFGAKNTIGAVLAPAPDASMAASLLYAANPATIPFSGALAAAEKFMTGPDRFYGRDGAIWLNIPVARSLLTNRGVNALGDPQGFEPSTAWSSLNNRAWYSGIPIMVSGQPTGNDKLVYDFILRRGTGPGLPQRAQLENENGNLWDSQWLDYVAARGRIVKAEMIRQLPRLERMDDEDLSKAFGEISSKATREAKRQFGYK